MIEAVFWDFGGVFTPSPFDAFDSYAAELGVTGTMLFETVLGPYHRDTDHPWHRLERGELSMEDAFVQTIETADAAGIEGFEATALFSEMGSGFFDARPEIVEAVRDLSRRGIRHAMVTNNVRELATSWRPLLPLDELFEVVIDSSEVGMRKPDPGIYGLALEEMGVQSSSTVFVDDLESNVVAARELGMHGVVFGPDAEVSLAELYDLVT
ncbi:MAG: HAD family phosphatase [Acidimicrobiia bacterium]|nr:HAD family phosphatase [Acidimicrobiia bacterium]